MSNNFMVIDDNSTNNLICKYTIRKFSDKAEISIFTEPEDALEFIKVAYGNSNGDIRTILFLDINMPYMTGWEFLEEFKELKEEIQKQFVIYMLSSSVDERDKEKAKNNPLVSGFYSKPLTIHTIKDLYSHHNLT